MDRKIDVEKVSATPPFAQTRLKLPAYLLVCVPGGKTAQEYAFNPIAVLEKQGEWENRDYWQLHPFVLAPGLEDPALRSLLRFGAPGVRGIGPDLDPGQVREYSFTAPGRHYAIVQFSSTPTDWNAVPNPGDLSHMALLDHLKSMETRLLVLETPDDEATFNTALNFGEWLVANGGPSILVVTGSNRSHINQYLAGFYANLLDNIPLPDAVQPQQDNNFDITSYLLYGQGVDYCLFFEQNSAAEPEIPPTSPVEVQKPNRLESLGRSIKKLTEGFFLKPLIGRGAEAAPPMEYEAAMVEPPEPSQPRRFLNANFGSGEVDLVPVNECLVAGQTYALWVEIGPLWTTMPSLFDTSATFPSMETIDQVLSEEDKNNDTFTVQVVFASQDFEPAITSDILVIPKNDDLPSNRAKLKVRTPNLTRDAKTIFPAHGRLCLYYHNNLLQSAQVQVSIAATTGIAAPTPNSGQVDYVLSSGFSGVQEQFEKRGIIVSGKEQNISINLTLNDDGSGHHRLLAKHSIAGSPSPNIPPAWKPYDPTSSKKAVEEFRRLLDWAIDPKRLIQFENFRDKFKEELVAFAVLGDRLRAEAFGSIAPGDNNMSGAEWQTEFFSALAEGTVIQLARTGSVPLTYIFPWAVIYEYPLESDPKAFKICRVVDEEWDEMDASRHKAPDPVCPHHDEHGENVVCPYGFWGFKHVIEQPISYLQDTGSGFDLRDKVDSIHTGQPAAFGAIITDRLEDLNRRDRHLETLKAIKKISAQTVTNNRSAAKSLLRNPEVVYFLCHGEKDENGNTYLSIGPGTDPLEHRIMPNSLEKWIMPPSSIDIQYWKNSHPLVFINSCHSTDMLPETTLSFVNEFSKLRAGGVIGTEVSVLTTHAYFAAEKFFDHLSKGEQVGQAIQNMRWDLLNNGLFTGLAYTPYCLAELHLSPEP